MCFSAGASFAAAGMLSVIGGAAVYSTRQNKKLLPTAASPLFFGVQQACEGLVWLTLMSGETTNSLHWFSTYAFLFFASAWWPIWIPWALYHAEHKYNRKKLLWITTLMGSIAGVLLFISWPLQTTGVEVINHHLNYPVNNYPFGITDPLLSQIILWCISLLYCTATITPLFISSIPYMWVVGTAIMAGLLVSYVFYFTALPSVWCFFAAVSSLLLFGVIKNYNKNVR